MDSLAEDLKVVLLGDSEVGKTSILKKIFNGKFDPNYTATLSPEYRIKKVEFNNIKKTIKYNIWDTAGKEEYRSITNIFYKDANVILLVYDKTNLKSFKDIKEYWYGAIKTKCETNIIIVLIANKSDLNDKEQVKNEEGEEFAKSIGAIFQSTSAKDNIGITDLFNKKKKKYFNSQD